MDQLALTVETEFKKYAKLLNKYSKFLNVANIEDKLSFERLDIGSAHVEIRNGNQFHYVVTERGSETIRKSTNSLDQLMYWLFSDITFSIASRYELKYRHPTNDFRRLMFSKQLELLGILSEKWSELKKQEIEAVLAKCPYEDEG